MSVLAGGMPNMGGTRTQDLATRNRHDRRVEVMFERSQRHAAELADSGSATTHANGQFLADLAERIRELTGKVTGKSES